MSENLKVGLVLSGGGAKGAYQVGVLKALAELKIPVDVIAGASIGSLNGAVLASAPNIEIGVIHLEEIWGRLAHFSPLEKQVPSYFTLMLSAGLRENLVVELARSLLSIAQYHGVKLPDNVHQVLHAGLMADAPLTKLIHEYIDHEALSNGIPFYVSVFRSFGGLMDIARVIAAELRLFDSNDSEFICIQALPPEEQKELLLASAAIPFIFAPRQVNHSLYSDGGQGGWAKSQGNTPITPLIECGCNVVIVTHLSNGSLWSRHDYPETTILEVRPQSSIARDTGMFGGVKDLLGFDLDKIPSWIEQGYQDASHCLGQVLQAIEARHALSISELALIDSERNNAQVDAALKKSISRLT